MIITVIGTGYVGLVTGACFAELGNHVTCFDLDAKKIDQLKEGHLPIFEPGLEAIVTTNKNEGRLIFTSEISETSVMPDVIFIAVGTPSERDGSANTDYVFHAAKTIGEHINKYAVIVDKSTVPVGMGDEVNKIIQAELNKRQLSIHFDVVSNPEFLREGAAIEDFMQPDRVIIGVSSEAAKQVMLDLYLPIVRNPERIYFMTIKDAEMTKYAANAMLATRISFMNEMSLLCDELGVDIESVRIGVGSDSRIGNAFLNAGCGYGGSCFPKDVRALIKMAEHHHIDPLCLRAVEERNEKQKRVLVDKIIGVYGENLTGLSFAIWGLAFKPGTDDMREAPSLTVLDFLISHGARVNAYDPKALTMIKELVPAEWLEDEKLILFNNQYAALQAVDALVLVTEWKSFSYPDIVIMQEKMRQRIVFDGRNHLDPYQLQASGFKYYGIGRGRINNELVINENGEHSKQLSLVQ